VTIPADTPAGAHTLVLKGKPTTGTADRTVNIGVTVTAAGATTSSSVGSTSSTTGGTATTIHSSGSGGLASTGANVLRIGLSSLMVLFAGWLLLVSAVARRDRVGSGR
jgi:hypothetical protein